MCGTVRYSFTIVAAVCIAAFTGERALGQVLKGDAAYGSLHDDRPGLRRLLTPQDLPPIEKPTYGVARVVLIPTGARPQVPDGAIRVAPNGDLFVADTMFGAVHVLRLPPGRAKPVRDEVFAKGLKQPFSIAFYPLGPNPRWVYIADSDGVVRFHYKNGDLKASGKPEQMIAGIPTTHHYASQRIFNGLAEWSKPEPSGAAWDTEQLRADDTHMQIVATELRSPEGEPVRGGYDAAKGRDLYIANCSACHQVSGEGVPGVFPPLKGSGVVNKDDATKHIHVVLDGMEGGRAGGVVYASAMPPYGGMLGDAEIADIIDYERSSWGNHGNPVTAAQVAAERASPK
jgi:mono/diheme cytochrome c family protein